MREATVTDTGPVRFKVRGATQDQPAAYVIGHADPAVGDTVLVERLEDSSLYVVHVVR